MVNLLAKRGKLEPGTELFGKAFENWVLHELSAHAAYTEQFYDISYWRLASGIEVDFILDDMAVAIEVKGSAKIAAHHLQGLRELKREYPRVKRRILVSMESRARKTDDGIEILPASRFVEQLWSGAVL